MNSTSSIKSTSSSSDHQSDGGLRAALEFADQLTGPLLDDKKRLIAAFLQRVDDETLTMLTARIESEKKSRKKGKDASKSGKKSNASSGSVRENGNHSNSQNNVSGSLGSSSMEVISESGIQAVSQTSPTTASRKTFAGFLSRKRDRVKSNKQSKKEKNGATAKSEAITETSGRVDGSRRDGNSVTDVRVDEEGYVIRDPLSSDQRKDADNFYSDSDSSDDEENKKPIHVIIKPINGSSVPKSSGSIAELKQTVKSLSISPSLTSTTTRRQAGMSGMVGATSDEPENTGHMKRSFSQHVYRADDSAFFPSNSHCSSSNLASSVPNSSLTNTSRLFHPKQQSSSLLSSGSGSTSGVAPAAPPEDRYAALSSLFAESNATNSDMTTSNGSDHSFLTSAALTSQSNSCSNLSKSMSSSSVMGPPAPVIPKPPSKNSASGTAFVSSHPVPGMSDSGFGAFSSSGQSSSAFQNSMQRCKSYGSLTSSDLRMTPISLNSVGSSRGPSPLTLGFNDTVPLAVALQESISARFKGSDASRCEVQMLGSLKIAFPSGIVQALTNNPTPAVLSFRISNTSRIDRLFPNQIILSGRQSITSGQTEYTFDVKPMGLVNSLKRSLEQTPNARYYYLDVLKYQLKNSSGADSCPLQVVSHWKCEPNSTGLKIDYKYNPSALSTLEPLRNVTFAVSIDGNVSDVQGMPLPVWNPLTRQASWSFASICHTSQDSGLGSLRAKFDVANGPSKPTPVSVQFSCSESTLSGIEFELLSPGYRLSLIKKQVIANRFASEADCSISYAGV